MIQKMKKLTFVVFREDYDKFLKSLQQLGVLHIQAAQDQSKAEAPTLQALKNRYTAVCATLAELLKISQLFEDEIPAGGSVAKGEQILPRIDYIKERKMALASVISKLERDHNNLQPWGNIDKNQMERLHAAGIQEYYYHVTLSQFDKELQHYKDTEVSRNKKFVYFLAFSTDGKEPEGIPALPMTLPEGTLAEVKAQLSTNIEEKQNLETEYEQILQENLSDIKAYQDSIANEIALEEARLKSQNLYDAAMVLEGWFPVNREAEVTGFLKDAEAYYETRLPIASDSVPTQFRNNSFARQFESLTCMYGVPGYGEWDPTPIVAPFFTLFFAICMGDAAYGVIITLFGLYLMTSKNARRFPILGEMLGNSGGMVTILGVATILVGILLGSAFGMSFQNFMPEGTSVYDYYTLVQGNFPGTTYSFQMVCAIIIGVLHLLIAMAVKATLFTIKNGFKENISQWGWLLLFMGSVVIGVCYMIGATDEETARVALIGIGAVSALCIYLLNNVGRMQSSFIKGILINPLAGLYDTYNMASGVLGDVLSYIRLYALCLAGGALGGAFNMIGDMIWHSLDGSKWQILTIFMACLIYFFGHMVNLLLSAISAFVHPLRLNFVEYFKNSGYEGKGTGYEPFKNK